MTLPIPPDTGVVWRHPEPSDATALAAHTKLVHEAEHLEFLAGRDFFDWLMAQPGIDPASDMLVAEVDGAIVADAGAWTHSGDEGARVFAWAEASPGHEALKPFLVEWAEQRALQRLADEPADRMRVIRMAVEEHRAAHRAVIEEAGFELARSFAEMARPLEDLPPPPQLPQEVEAVQWSPELDEGARSANNESFADHWGSLPMSAEEWAGMYVESPTFRPDLSFLAVAGGEVMALCMCEVDEEDNAERDTDDMYIQRVGTRVSHRRQGLASHLIVLAMEAAQRAGLDRAALEVDEMSHTRATLVYERLGFAVTGKSIHYVKTL